MIVLVSMSTILNSRSAISRPISGSRLLPRVPRLSKQVPRIHVSVASTSGNLTKHAEAPANSGQSAAHSEPDQEAQDAAASTPPTPKKGALKSGVLPFNLGELNKKTAAREAAQARLRNLPTLFSEKDASIDM